MYHDEIEYQAGNKVNLTTIEIDSVNSVCFHYDKNAPVKSKKLNSSKVDPSRFDIYTKERVFNFKASSKDV